MLISLLLLLLLEYWSNGYYFKSSFLYPREVFSSSAAWVEDYPWQLLRSFFYNQLWIFYVAITGITLTVITNPLARVLITFVALELIIFFKIGHNIGGSIVYLYFLGFLFSLFFSQLTGNALSSLLNSHLFSRVVAVSIVFTTLFLSQKILIEQYAKRKLHYKFLIQAQAHIRESQLALDSITKNLSKEENWFATRYATPLLNKGIVLDREACTLQFALDAPSFIDQNKILSRFASGQYKYIWYAQAFRMAILDQVLPRCFQKIYDLPWSNRSNDFSIQIYKFKGCF